jgi:hypothetical protein
VRAGVEGDFDFATAGFLLRLFASVTSVDHLLGRLVFPHSLCTTTQPLEVGYDLHHQRKMYTFAGLAKGRREYLSLD